MLGSQGKIESLDRSRTTGRALIVLCTYNEIENLPQAIATLQLVAPECDILVVDDNSPDGTGKWTLTESQRSPQATSQIGRVHLIARARKLGLGSALRDAIRWCLERDYEFMVNLDADLSHDPAKVPELLALARSQAIDVVIGSRYVAGGAMDGLSLIRRMLSRGLNRYAAYVLNLPVLDCSGSFRCYRVSKLRELQIDQLTCNGYGFLEEILVTLYRHGATLLEIPITYHIRRGGKSKLSLSDATGALGVIHKLRGK